MTFKNFFRQATLIGLTLFVMLGCDTTRNIYKISTSKKDYVTINAVTLSHCGCTEIYAESFKNGKREFQIFYNDNLARKTIFDYNASSKTPATTSLLATSNDNFTTPFDDLDSKIFSLIDSAIVKKRELFIQSTGRFIRDILLTHYYVDNLFRDKGTNTQHSVLRQQGATNISSS